MTSPFDEITRVVAVCLRRLQHVVSRFRSYHANTDLNGAGPADRPEHAPGLSLQLIAESIPAPVAVMTPAGDVEVVNHLILEYFGKTLDELKGWRTADAIHPEDLPQVVAAWIEAIEKGRRYEVESRHRRVDGIYRWFHVHGFPLRDRAGRILNWCVLLTDIDDQKRAEMLLAGENRILEMVARGLSLTAVLDALCKLAESVLSSWRCGILLLDPGGLRFRLGAAPSLPASYSAALDNLAIDDQTAPSAMAAYVKRQISVPDLASDSRWHASGWRDLALGRGRRSFVSTPIMSGDQRVLGTFDLCSDEPGNPSRAQLDLIEQFTQIASIAIERAQGEAALKRSQTFLAEGQQLSRAGTFSWRVANDEIKWSEELYHIFEFDIDTPLTLELVSSRVHPEDIPRFAEMVNLARGTGNGFEYEHRLLMPDLSVKYIYVTARATRDDEGQLEYIGAAQDVTQRRLSEEALGKARLELAHSARVMSLGVLTASIAHEIKHPLASIITNGQTALRWLGRPEPEVNKATVLTERIVADAKRATEIIERIRATATGRPPKRGPLSVDDVIEESVGFLRFEFQSKGVVVSTDLAPALPQVVGDRTQLQQVVVNLVNNAVQATAQSVAGPRSVLIRTVLSDADTVCCSVEDSGPGIEAAHLPHLFDSFFTTKDTGMGMGLPISQSIVEAHGGELRVDNHSALGGARFSFFLPANGAGNASHEIRHTGRA
jgi:PAS domain S-box-containing protein